MGLGTFLLNCFDQNHRSTLRSLDGLTQEELAWQPNDQCNSIGFLVWHVGRVLDFWIHTIVQSKPQLWEQGWADRFGREANPRDIGYSFTPERVAGVSLPESQVLVEYLTATHDKVAELLKGLNDDALANTQVSNPSGGQMSLTTLFQQLVWEMNQHGGQIAYLRGIQRGLEDRYYTGGVTS